MTPSATPAVSTSPSDGSLEARLFGDAELLDNGSGEEFLAMLADPDIPAIMLTNCHFTLSETTEIKKPVYLMANCHISMKRPLTVGKNGHLMIGGSLPPDLGDGVEDGFPPEGNVLELDFLRTVDDGKIYVNARGLLNVLMLWLSDADGFLVGEGEEGNYTEFVLSEEEVFANATHVTSEQEYLKALQQGKPIVIDADISITEESLPAQDVPVKIGEGVTVRAAAPAWVMDSTVLVNYGRFEGTLMDTGWRKCHIINYGTVDAKIELGHENVFFNYGSVRIPQGSINSIYMYNMGEFFAADAGDAADGRYTNQPEGWEGHGQGHLAIAGGMFHNFGAVTVEYTGSGSGSCEAFFEGGGGLLFKNMGTLEIGAYGCMLNVSQILNAGGSIRCTDESGTLANYGVIRNEGEDCVLDLLCADISRGSNTGVILYGEEMEISLPENICDDGGSLIHFEWGEERGDGCWVKNQKELEEAMADENCRIVMISDQGEFILPAGMEITKGLAVPGNANLKIGGDLVLRGKDAFVLFDAVPDLSGGKVIVENGTCLFSSGASDCGGITIRQTDSRPDVQVGKLCFMGKMEIREGAPVMLEGGNLISIGELSLDHSQVQIKDGVLRTCGNMNLKSCDVAIDGQFLVNSEFSMDEGTTLVNHKGFDSSGSFGSRMFMGKFTNYGDCYLYCWNHEIGGQFINEGRLHLGGDITVSGSFTNKGELVYDYEGAEIFTEEGGKVTGVPKK